MPIKHTFTSPKSDGADTTLVRPSDWNADHSGSSQRSVTLVVAASDSLAVGKAAADYICDGTADDVEILAALAAGGSVFCLRGTYHASGTIALIANQSLTFENGSVLWTSHAAIGISMAGDNIELIFDAIYAEGAAIGTSACIKDLGTSSCLIRGRQIGKISYQFGYCYWFDPAAASQHSVWNIVEVNTLWSAAIQLRLDSGAWHTEGCYFLFPNMVGAYTLAAKIGH